MKKISNIRLVSHQLSEAKNKKARTPQEVVQWMGAVQAQDYNMAKWAIGIRAGVTEKETEAAFNRGQILRTHVLRPTWHFVSPENIRWMLILSAERIKASSQGRDRDLEITEKLYTRSNNVLQKALEGKHLTRTALAEALEKAKIKTDTARMVHFMMRAEVEGIVCSGAVQGKNQTYALLDERAEPAKPLSHEEALAQLAQIYFNSHCPATLQDFVWWSGLSTSEARQGLDAVKSSFTAENIDGQIYWLCNAIGKIVPAKNSVLLLPAFDEYLIAYRDRQAVIHSANHSKAISSNGIFRPVIVADGQVIGLWKKSALKSKIADFEFFEPADEDLQKRTHDASLLYRQFLG